MKTLFDLGAVTQTTKGSLLNTVDFDGCTKIVSGVHYNSRVNGDGAQIPC